MATSFLLGMAAGCQKTDNGAAPSSHAETAEHTGAPECVGSNDACTSVAVTDMLPSSTLVSDVGFVLPGTAIIDEKRDLYLVSNASTHPLESANNGFISVLSPKGEMIAPKWIQGGKKGVTLNAPKGMAIRSNILYIADVSVIRKFDLQTGAPNGDIAINDATYLNDIAVAPNGTLFVTDTGLTPENGRLVPSHTDSIYAVDIDDKVTTVASGDHLKQPNGVYVAANGLYVVSFSTPTVLFVSFDGKVEETAKVPGSRLDGVVRLPDGDLLVTSWHTSALLRGRPEGPFTAIKQDLKTPADFSYDRKRNQLVIPLAQQNALLIQPLNTATSRNNTTASPSSAPAS